MANYYDKNRKLETPGGSALSRDASGDELPKRGKLPPQDPTVQDPGQPYVPPAADTAPDGGPPVQTLGGMDQTGLPPRAGLQKDGLIVENDTVPGGGGAVSPPAASSPQQNPMTDLSTVKKVSDALANGSLMNSPLMQQIAANQAKLISLKMQPTYIDRSGKTVNGMKDMDGRWKSGLRAMLENLAQPGQTRDWGSLLAKVSGSISAGVTGAIVPEWDENVDRLREINKLEGETKDLMGMASWQSQMATADTNRENSQKRVAVSQGQLQERQARNSYLKVRDDQKSAVEPIFKRGYYYEGDNPEEDAKLAKMNIVLPDFDNSRKPIVDNGQRKAWNPQTRTYEPIQGSEVDPDEVPMTFSIDGQNITASRKQFMGYAGAKERQQSQQKFQSTENEKNRAAAAERQSSQQTFQTGRQDARTVDEASKVLAAIRLNAPKGTSEEAIIEAQQRYKDGLRPEIKDKLPK